MRKPYDTIEFSLTEEDWMRVHNALRCYIIQREQKLSSTNCGDREWQDLCQYECLERDIDRLIIGVNHG